MLDPSLKISWSVGFSIQKATFAGFIIAESIAETAF